MNQRIRSVRELNGELIVPGDKSISHRALICNAMATGTAKITNFSSGMDCASTLVCLRDLGVSVEPNRLDSSTVIIAGSSGLLTEPVNVLDAGNSGTTIRLLSGVIAGQSFCAGFTGDSSLRSRPMDRIIIPLNEMGARVTGSSNNTRIPLSVCGGGLKGITYELPVSSAQLKSCLILAAIQADGQTLLINPGPSRDHTERMLSSMGGKITTKGNQIMIQPGPLNSCDIRVPGDLSSAAFWLVSAIVHPNAKINLVGVGINPSRTAVLDVLWRMGANIRLTNICDVGNEPVADIEVESSTLRSIEIEGEEIGGLIDELPVLAVAACFASGKTVIRDAGELRTKESDRIRTMVLGLAKLGADVEELPDGMVIRGPVSLRGSTTDSGSDHRIAMALAVSGLLAKGETIIENSDCVDISYPTFWRDIEIVAPGSTA